MSGGHFNYDQYKIRYIAEAIEEELENQGEEIDERELQCYSEEYLLKYPEDRYHRTYSEEVQKIFKEAIRQLKIAEIYATRIDQYLSGDDSAETMKKRLKEELEIVESVKKKGNTRWD